MSLASEYWRLQGFETLEIPDVGFANFAIKPPECYIRDIYVKPKYRHKHIAARLADRIAVIAKSQRCKILIGSVDPTYKDHAISERVLISYGMKFGKELAGLRLFFKEI